MNQISRDELQKYMMQYQLDHTIGDLTPTVCALFGVPEPADCGAFGVAAVVDQAEHMTGKSGGISRGLIFCPDAVGEVHRQKYPEKLARVEKLAGFRIPAASVMPSVTPVCYGTIFSGASPEVHGIRKYEKPVLTVQTLFDVFADAGKEVAIVSVNNCSIDTIFRCRKVDYFSFRTDAQSFEMTKKLIAENKYDLIICYYTSYDHLSHKHGPYAPVSEESLETAVCYFEELTALTDQAWQKYDRVTAWIPDHGNHVVDEHSGTHGTNTAEDMVVNHFYRLRSAE